MAETLFQGFRRFNGGGLVLPREAAARLPTTHDPEELLKVLQDSVIPQLHNAEGTQDEVSLLDAAVLKRGEWARALGAHQLATLALRQDHDAGLQFLADLHASGVSRNEIYDGYLGGAALLLGEEWYEDRQDFTEVTLGTAYLQRLLREFSLLFNDQAQLVGQHHRIFLIPAGSDQHTLGISVLGELFRDAGWDVWGGPRIDRDELVGLLSRDHYDVVGLSIASERQLPQLAEQIGLVRQHSRNPDVCVMVGGSLLNLNPGIAEQIDADCTPKHGEDVVAQAAAAVEGRSVNAC